MDLNNPDIRQDLLRQRLAGGEQLVVARIADEFDISVDTVRRDLIALEAAGAARRVRGGAVRAAIPAAPMDHRVQQVPGSHASLARAALDLVGDARTLVLDGGTTVLALARILPPAPDRLIVTPSPWVAIACMANGHQVVMIGGRLSPSGGINVGQETESGLADLAADIAILGACGLDADFGLSSDDLAEAGVKRAMAAAARETIVLADRSKLGLRARHRTLDPAAIDHLVTDGGADQTAALSEAGVRLHHV